MGSFVFCVFAVKSNGSGEYPVILFFDNEHIPGSILRMMYKKVKMNKNRFSFNYRDVKYRKI